VNYYRAGVVRVADIMRAVWPGEEGMSIYGLSQSTGVERLVEVTGTGEGLQLRARERIGNVEREPIVVPTDELLSAITAREAGGRSIEALAGAAGARKVLDIEVRGNEVLLCVRPAEGGWDVAVGLDDFQDALEGAVTPA
jgi:hypothetical protein